MTAILILIPVSLLLLGVAVWAFFWANGQGQYDDLEAPGWSILQDDEPPIGPVDASTDPSSSERPARAIEARPPSGAC